MIAAQIALLVAGLQIDAEFGADIAIMRAFHLAGETEGMGIAPALDVTLALDPIFFSTEVRGLVTETLTKELDAWFQTPAVCAGLRFNPLPPLTLSGDVGATYAYHAFPSQYGMPLATVRGEARLHVIESWNVLAGAQIAGYAAGPTDPRFYVLLYAGVGGVIRYSSGP